MRILVSGATRTVSRHPELGVLIGPRCGNSIEGIAASGRYWAADNDAFKAWDAEKFWAMIAKIAKVDRSRFLFVACPDVVCNARETVDRWHEWYPQVEYLGLPAAFVGQNGLEEIEDRIPWDDLAAFFVGGDDGWKLGAAADRLVSEAKSRGKWVHIGRVNTRRRIRHFVEIGADSIDGRGFSKWPDINIPKGLRWIRNAEEYRYLFIHR